MEEEWKDIEGYEGLYQVSNTGLVKNKKREKVLALEPSNCIYLRVHLWKNGVGKHYLVHRLVAEAFIDNPNNLPQVNHKDEDKTNNNVDNLEWCTVEYNHNYGTVIERIKTTQQNDKNKSKVILQYTLDGQFVAEYPSIKEASRQTGLDDGNISHCCRRKKKTLGGYIWRYKNEGN